MDEYANIIYYSQRGFEFFDNVLQSSELEKNKSYEDFDLVFCLATIAGISLMRPQPIVGELLYEIGHVYSARAEEFYILSYKYGFIRSKFSLAAVYLYNNDYKKCFATLQQNTGLSSGTSTYKEWDMSTTLIGKINRALLLRALDGL